MSIRRQVLSNYRGRLIGLEFQMARERDNYCSRFEKTAENSWIPFYILWEKIGPASRMAIWTMQLIDAR